MRSFKIFLASMICACGMQATAQTVATGEGAPEAAADSYNPNPIANLSARIGYNTDSGFVGGLGYETERFLGQDADFSMRIEAQEGATRFNVSYGNDAIFGESPRFGLTLSHSETTEGDVYGFESTATRLQPRLTWDLTERSQISTFLNYSRNEIGSVDATDSILIRNDEGQDHRLSLGATYRAALPIEGSGPLRRARFSFGIEAGHTSRDHEFAIFTARASTVHTFGDGNVIIGSSVRLGHMATMEGTSNIGDRFMLGSSSLRGFAFGGFGPRDLAVDNEPALGGTSYGIGRFDARFPNAFGSDSSLTPGVFLDAGSLWGLDDVNGGLAGADPVDDAAYLRSAAGVTLRIDTGIGPFNIYAAVPLAEEDYDQTQEFGLSFSQSF
ncbi:BamA/TamA family outer membrane protein [Gymnodinialimonas ceratoperidinii]|uniref:BamA/TamA family outer membrane protein n=1 Tax=Gymnodinialimonas ceratoperidinii TaxID=2856823 RepID=A0A8F6TXC2_9RHOB|nr:BamA/TamA family outer membrane protein [Gymnodinialimonas ceratoperidinii]QXT39467.1 BamA/TamA family outer membrane protein [Gymnodinialimonas ceratoperidinii]